MLMAGLRSLGVTHISFSPVTNYVCRGGAFAISEHSCDARWLETELSNWYWCQDHQTVSHLGTPLRPWHCVGLDQVMTAYNLWEQSLYGHIFLTWSSVFHMKKIFELVHYDMTSSPPGERDQTVNALHTISLKHLCQSPALESSM